MTTLSLADFRKRYPKANGLTDDQLLEVAADHYGASVNEMKSILNYEPPAPRSRTWGEVAGDTLVTATKSAVGLPQSFVGLIDIPTGGRVGKALEDIGYRPNETQNILSDMYSDPQKAANKRVSDAQGFADTAVAYAKNPSTILTTVGESAGQMSGGASVARKLISLFPKLAPWAAGALGEGLMGAGSAESQLRAESKDGLTTAKQGLSALASGAGTAAFSALGGKIANSKLGQKVGIADIDTMLAGGGTSPKTTVGFLKSAVASGISEGALEEMPQSAWEQMMQNYAQDKPILDGVSKAMASGAVAGFAMGGAGGGYNAMVSKIEPPQAIMDQPDIDSAINAAENSIEQLPVVQKETKVIDDPMRLDILEQLPEKYRDIAIRAYNLIIDDESPKGIKKENRRVLDDILEQAASEMQSASATRIDDLTIEQQKPLEPFEQIKQLQSRLESNGEWDSVELLDELQSTVTNYTASKLESGEMPVFTSGELTIIVTPSAKQEGLFQVTRYSRNGAIGDSEYTSIEKAVESEGLQYNTPLSGKEAVAAITQANEAEGNFQSRLAEQKQKESNRVLADIESTDSRVSFEQEKSRVNQRNAIIDSILASDAAVDMRPAQIADMVKSSMVEQGYANPVLSDSEFSRIKRFNDIAKAEPVEEVQDQTNLEGQAPSSNLSELVPERKVNANQSNVIATKLPADLISVAEESKTKQEFWKALTARKIPLGPERNALMAAYKELKAQPVTPTATPATQSTETTVTAIPNAASSVTPTAIPNTVTSVTPTEIPNSQSSISTTVIGEPKQLQELSTKSPSNAGVSNIDSVRKLIDDNGGEIFIRWSGGANYDLNEGASSRDYLNGSSHAGLSAVPLTSDMSDHEIAKYIGEYSFLRLKDKNIAPHFYAGEKVGEDSDGYPSIKPSSHLGTVSKELVSDLDNNLAEKIKLNHEINKAELILSGNSGDKIGRQIIAERLDVNRKKLQEINATSNIKNNSLQESVSVDPSVSKPVPSTTIPETTLKPDGNLSIKGNTKELQTQLKEAGIPSLPSRDGVTVGAKNVEKAQEFIASIVPAETKVPEVKTENNLVSVDSATIGPASKDYQSAIVAPANEAIDSGKAIKVELKDGSSVDLVNMTDKGGARTIVAVSDGSVVGSLGYATVEGFSPDAYVDKDFQRKGIASAMYDLAEKTGGVIPPVDATNAVRTEEGAAFRNARAGVLSSAESGVKLSNPAQQTTQKVIDNALESDTTQIETEGNASASYTLPEKKVEADWKQAGATEVHPNYKPNDRQKILIDAVAAELDAGVFYSSELVEKVSKRLNVPNDVLESNRAGVQDGDFGYDVYLARKYVESQKANNVSKSIAGELSLNVGDSVGTLVTNDGKRTTNVKIESISDSGLIATFTGNRGKYTVTGQIGVDSIKHSINRAKERNHRKDNYDEFISTKSKKVANSEPSKGNDLSIDKADAKTVKDQLAGQADIFSGNPNEAAKEQIQASDLTPAEKLANIAAVNRGDVSPDDVAKALGTESKPYDQARAQELQNSIDEGELILRTGKLNDRKLSDDKLSAVRRSVESSKAKLAALGTPPNNIRYSKSKSNEANTDNGLGDVKIVPAVIVEKNVKSILAEEGAVQVNVSGGNVDVLKQIAERFGKKIVFFREVETDRLQNKGLGLSAGSTESQSGTNEGSDSTQGENGSDEVTNGFVTPRQPKLVFLNVDGANHLTYILGHELGHSLKIDDPKLWAEMTVQLQPLVRKFGKYRAEYGQGLTNDVDVLEELVSDVIGDNFLNNAFWQDMAKQSQSLFKRIADKAIALLNKSIRLMVGRDVSIFISDMEKARSIIAETMLKYVDGVSKGRYEAIVNDASSAQKQLPATIEIDGVDRPTTNSNGKPLAATEEGVKNFWRWFGDSKVVDANGKPMVVYHGTTYREITEFLPEGGNKEDGKKVLDLFRNAKANDSRFGYMMFRSGTFFSSMPKYAENYTGENTGVMYPAYIKAENPIFKEMSKAGSVTGTNPNKTPDALILTGENGIFNEIAIIDPTQIKSATGNNGKFDGGNSDIRYSKSTTSKANPHSWDSLEEIKFDSFLYKYQDKHIDTKRVVDAIDKNIADDLNVYEKEETYHNKAASRNKAFINNELRPLIDSMRELAIDTPTLDEYLHARTAEETNVLIAWRNRDTGILKDGGSGMKTADARKYLASLTPSQRAKLESLAAKVDAITEGTRQMYVDYGLESKSTIDGWRDMFDHYVPLMREQDGDTQGMGVGQGFSVKGKEVKGRTGSTRKVVDIFANIAMQREKVIARGEKNKVAKSLLELASANPNPEFWSVGKPETKRVYNPDTDSVVEQADPLFKSRENVIVAKVKDSKGNIEEKAVIFVESNPRALRMSQALKNLDTQQMNGFMGGMAKVTRYFSAINTQYNPIFGVVNLVRDFQGALINLSSTALSGHKAEVAKHTLSAMKAIYLDGRAGKKGGKNNSAMAALWREFELEGGPTGYRDMFANSEDRAKAIENELNPTKWMDSPLGKVFTANGMLKVPLAVAQKQASGMFGVLSDYNTAMENSVRLAAYKVAKEQGMSNQKAASLAKNLTVNFNRKGQVAQQVGALYAFFNASMQGSARLSKTLFTIDKGDIKTARLSSTGKKIVYGGVLLGVVQALMLSEAGLEEDEPPEFVRERSLIIPTGWTGLTDEKAYINIPMPLGLHVLPNLGRIPTEFALNGFKKPTEKVIGLMGLVAGAFNPTGGGVSLLQAISFTATDPIAALAENKDWTGKPIAKESYNKALPGHALAKDTSSYVSKILSQGFNYLTGGTEYTRGTFSPTPDQIDYLIGQAFGGVGREALKTQQSISATMTGEDLPIYKVPLVGRFYGNAESQSSQANRFYANVDLLNEHETEIKGMREDRKGLELARYMRENPEARMFESVNKVEREIQQLRKVKRDLLKADAEPARIKMIENQIKMRMTRFNESFASVSKSLN